MARMKPTTKAVMEAAVQDGRAPATPAILHQFLRELLHIEISTEPLLQGSTAPFDYLVHTFFEGAMEPWGKLRTGAAPADCVVWAARGAGKTFLGAVATMLDLVFKPRIDVRILGGSLEQSQRMHEHLRRLFEHPSLAALLDAKITERRVLLSNGSRARILSQSQTSVRGTRVQKLRCDEVELFDPQVWEAAQLTTRSMPLSGPWGKTVRGSVEALSTMHQPFGLMWKLVTDSSDGRDPAAPEHAATQSGSVRRVVFRWGLIDVLAKCGPEHACGKCAIEPECGGRAKTRDKHRRKLPGHVGVDDAVRMKSRVSRAAWESEMLCLRPRRTDCVLPEFDAAAHVGDWSLAIEPGWSDVAPQPTGRRWVAGMDFGIRAPTVALLAWYRHDDPEKVLHVEAEHVKSDWTIDQHAAVLLSGGAPGWPSPMPAIGWIGVDPAGNQRSEQTGVSSIAALRKAGLSVRWRRLQLHQGLDLLRTRLKPAANRLGGAGNEDAVPRLLIHRRCVKLIESLTRYHYPEDRPESLEPVKDGSDHAVDALRYLVTCLDKPHTASVSTY